ncbi:hypothetical protein ANN_18320 [Periplaneta americana]|uniref:Long-chain-fatty-acid--CoA ligase n=1 Tax=Periplaneta americana TaxID=6978 RepID=A0ABQ8SNE9_PERAM|nr:hypothetical protein ANN_18320 [Periplaneta americana]
MKNKEMMCGVVFLACYHIVTEYLSYDTEKDCGIGQIKFEVVRGELSDMPVYQFSPKDVEAQLSTGAISLSAAIMSSSSIPLDLSECAARDKMLYIYTSGTTGLPKAAVITNLRFMFLSVGVHYMLNVQNDDILYTPLPLYHTAGGMVGVGQVLLFGCTMAIRTKFSASNFWADCVTFKCTVAQYIGEMCRYLLSVPSRPEERQHDVRLMFGNGLRPQIWESFVTRFGIKQIGEFYGATEGNSNLVNINSTVGAVGFVPRYAGPIYPVALIRIDENSGEPIRGNNGLCIRCSPVPFCAYDCGTLHVGNSFRHHMNQAMDLSSRLFYLPFLLMLRRTRGFCGKNQPKKAISNFSGYADRAATEKKIVYDVFTRGDQVFNSGDILVMDEFGYFYFKDRTGDTFRWRGENVATSEVEAVVSNVAGLKDAVVYGVEVPNVEGRAGMAAVLDTDGTLNLVSLARGVQDHLPSYARPLFIRVLLELEMTGTYKLKKKDLQLEGFNPNKIKDSLYFLSGGQYIPLTLKLYDDIVCGRVRL